MTGSCVSSSSSLSAYISRISPPADSTHKPDEDEDITARVMSAADAKAMVARGEIVDLKTAYALTLI